MVYKVLSRKFSLCFRQTSVNKINEYGTQLNIVWFMWEGNGIINFWKILRNICFNVTNLV